MKLRNRRFSLLQFLLIFFLLSISFYSYIGIVSPGGKAYSSFLDNNANFPAWVTYFICQCSKVLLQLAGFDVYQKALNNITIRGSRGINIIWACLGFGVISFWTAFVMAHRASWKYKSIWALIGVVSITVLNIIRITSIALGNYYNWKAYIEIEPHFAFNVASYVVIFGLMFWFIRKYNEYDINREKLSAIQ